jgi:hypothetical protein
MAKHARVLGGDAIGSTVRACHCVEGGGCILVVTASVSERNCGVHLCIIACKRALPHNVAVTVRSLLAWHVGSSLPICIFDIILCRASY